MFNINNIDLTDIAVYRNIYHSGRTWGIFQMDSNIGSQTCKSFQPSNIEEISLCVSIVRPSVLKAYDANGVSMNRVICNRKHGIEKNPEPIHPILKPILESTYYVIVFQEQIIEICKLVAGFDGNQADLIRKSVGRKDQKLFSQLKSVFLEGCKSVGILTEEQATDLFTNIRAASRYGFNKCLSPSTLVETKTELQTLEDVNIGEYIKCPDGFKKIVNKYNSSKIEVVEITLASGKTIECSLDHKFLCDDGEIRPLYLIIRKKYKIMCDKNRKMQAESIIGIRDVGEIDTIDIEVDSPNHIFFANGIATSNSHAVSYAISSVQTAYAKNYYPLEFYTAYLMTADTHIKPQQYIKECYLDAKTNNIDILIPCLHHKKSETYIKDGKIYFSVNSIKGIGSSALKNLFSIIEETETLLNKTLDKFSWLDFLFFISPKISSSVVEGLIFSGALDYYKKHRSAMIFEFEKYNLLTKGEKKWLVNRHITSPFNSFLDALYAVSPRKKDGGGCHTEKKSLYVQGIAESVKNPTLNTKDSPYFISMMEEKYLGVGVSCVKHEGMKLADMANYTCQNVNRGMGSQNISLAVEINRISEHKIKNGNSMGKWMAFLDIYDDSGCLNEAIVIFSDIWEEIRDGFDEKASYFLICNRGKKNSLIVENIQKIC